MAHSRTRVFVGNDAEGNPTYSWVGGLTQDERNDNIVREYFRCGRLWEIIGCGSAANNIIPDCGVKHDFVEYAWDYYKRYKEPHLQDNSKVREISTLNALERFFAGKNIEDITTSDIQDFMNARAESGSSATTIGDNVKMIRQVLASAVEDGYCKTNVATSARLTKVGKDTDGTEALPLDTIKRIIDGIPSIEDRQIKLAISFLALTGVRREEMLGLKWEDINFKSNLIHIQRAVTYPRGVALVKATKTKAGNRFIPMPDMLIDVLNGCGVGTGFIFSNDGTTPLSDRRVDGILDGIRKVTGLPNVTAKMFRTTFATMMAASNNIDVKKLQTIMGHSKAKTTMDIYAKVERSRLNVDRNVLTDFVKTATH